MTSLTGLTPIHAKVAFGSNCLYKAIHPEEKIKYISWADTLYKLNNVNQ